MSLCGKCGHDNDAGKDFCSQCGEFLGWDDDAAQPPRSGAAAPGSTAPSARPAAASPVRPTAAAMVAANPAVRQAQEEARIAEEEAERVRAEADARARLATETAKRRATEEAREARDSAFARAQEVVDVATRTAGGSRAEVAALVAQVRREAESKAKAEVEDAELRAARRARRAREEAHARAQLEAAEAERKAKQAAERASALIARTPARPAPPAHDDTAGALPPASPAGAGGISPGQTAPSGPPAAVVAPMRPVLPAAPQWRPPSPQTPEPAQQVNPGDVVCRQCATGNEPSRRFCRRCGESLVFVPIPPRLGWFRRSWGWLRSKLSRDPRDRAEAPGQGPASGASSGPGLSTATVSRAVLAVVAVVGMFAALGPYRQQARARLTSLRQHIVPKPAYIYGEVATGGPKGSCTTCLTDKLLTPVEFTSDQLSTDPPAPGSPPVFSVSLGKDGDLTKPVNVFKVGIIGGTLGDGESKHPAPHHVLLVAYGTEGHEEKSKTFSLHDDASFQSFLFVVNHVLRVDVFVLDTYNSASRQGPYAIDEIEFFALT